MEEDVGESKSQRERRKQHPLKTASSADSPVSSQRLRQQAQGLHGCNRWSLSAEGSEHRLNPDAISS